GKGQGNCMERREAYPTDTQHIVNLSGYVWAARQVPQLDRMRVLDLACGTGYGSDYLSSKAGRVVGVDCSPQIVARNRARYGGSGASFVAMDGCALGFRNASFDCVISQDTIEHIVDDRRFVAEVARVLRATGILVIFTPHGKNAADKPEDPFHVREYNQEEFREILSPYFSTIRWFGRRQGERLKAAERSMDAIRKFDPGGIRNLVPRPIRHWLGGLISQLQGGPALRAITPDDIEYGEGVAADTNLIGICLK
ncbi:MAG: class I SAM-dependent methyltransferase, partial [Nitrospira sp.]|nr:class I SAM-dependent methyltransferase [Nitrospira sp.]